MAKKAEEEAPRLRKEGEEGGYAQVGFDRERRCNYHLNALGEKVYHGIPAGYEFNEHGKLQKLPDAA